MRYVIWHSNDREKDKDKLLNMLLSNRSFAEVFEGDNPIHPLEGIIKIHQKKYRITRFEKVGDDMVEVRVVSVTGVSEAA
jgi:hypothetical protein